MVFIYFVCLGLPWGEEGGGYPMKTHGNNSIQWDLFAFKGGAW